MLIPMDPPQPVTLTPEDAFLAGSMIYNLIHKPHPTYTINHADHTETLPEFLERTGLRRVDPTVAAAVGRALTTQEN